MGYIVSHVPIQVLCFYLYQDQVANVGSQIHDLLSEIASLVLKPRAKGELTDSPSGFPKKNSRPAYVPVLIRHELLVVSTNHETTAHRNVKLHCYGLVICHWHATTSSSFLPQSFKACPTQSKRYRLA